MDEVRGRFRTMERADVAYEALLAGFSGFTLQRWLQVPTPKGHPGEVTIRTADVYESHDAAEVAELRRLLAARATSGLCRCGGSASISLEGGAAAAVLNLHHGVRVRWDGARRGDFELERGRELAEWLAARGVPDILNEMNELARRSADDEAERSAWAAAMPASVFPYRGELINGPGYDPPELMRQLSQDLKDEEPDAARRIRALLSWYAGGSGGRFSFYPGYESYPQVLLLDEEPGALLAVVSAPDLTAAELAGAARLVAICVARHRSEFDSLPCAAWDRLIVAAAESGDEAKRDRLARGRADREPS